MAHARWDGDCTPVNMDEEYASTTPFGTRVAGHVGPLFAEPAVSRLPLGAVA